MALESKYKEAFSNSQRDRGNILFSQNAIRQIQGNDHRITAEIIDTDSFYEVTLSCFQKELKIKCECTDLPNKPCAHIWAVLLAADKRELLKDGNKRGTKLFGTAAARKRETVKAPSNIAVIPREIFTPLYNKEDLEVSREILYVVNSVKSIWFKQLSLELYWRPVNEKGPLKEYFPESGDQSISSSDQHCITVIKNTGVCSGNTVHLENPELMSDTLDSLVCKGKLFTRRSIDQLKFAKVKECCQGEINWQFSLNSDGYLINPVCNDETYSDFVYVSKKLLILPRQIIHLKSAASEGLFDYIFENGFHVPPWEVEGFIESILLSSGINLTALPGRLKCERENGEPKGHLHIRTALFKFRDKEQLHADLSFHYSGKNIPESDLNEEVLDFYNSKVLIRNRKMEEGIRERLNSLGFRFNEQSHKEEHGWKLLPVKLPEIVDTLLKEGWLIVAEGKSYKAPISFKLKLSSGEDWFELNGEALFEDEKIFFPELMKSAEKGERYVQLGDGSFGVLPEEWLKHYTVLTQLGEIVGDNLRFRKSQALIIENLLQELLNDQKPSEIFKEEFEESLRANIENTPLSFNGILRPYQIQGLSWLKFLRKVGLGGILADDMGLGKTVQILALLSSINGEMKNPVLLVVPKSLIFNWIEEVQKFTPHLKVMEYGGSSRKFKIKSFNNFDIIVTTYGTVRQDAEHLIKEYFEYCILDEAQAIKNRDSSTHKAIRLLNAANRISMSGTPIENSLSDLISQFEFLNPGMAGQGKLQDLLQGDVKLSKETLNKLKAGFKPFILRRTKSQVAKDLPPKTEQIIYCEMDEEQEKLYSKMLKYYKQEMAKKEKEGKAGIEYLGALTRLRQMSCHPALVSEEFDYVNSSKVEILIDKLEEIISEGHRALVFSQFTSFLSIIRNEIEKRKWSYCYLDGSTKDRQGEVIKFQQNETPVFLISLKAGGVGLNLTAADYVFIMDPWWNPAIESQAIDRAYRIGQNKHVIACKLISKGTVEEKVLKMQRVKKYLADSVIEDDTEMVSKLTLADFKQLLE